MAISSVALNSVASVDARERSAPGVSRGEALGFERTLAQVKAAAFTGVQAETPTRRAVQPGRTPLSGEQAASAIASAYEARTGQKPSAETLAILTSHWSLETAQGTRMFNFNFAGIKGHSPDGMTAVMRTREGFGERATHIRDGFRAYSTAEAGAADYVGLLERRYAPALEAAKSGDPVAFAQKLKAGGYYTGNEAQYAQGITRLANRAMALGLDAIGASPGSLATAASPLDAYFGSPEPSDTGFVPGETHPAARYASLSEVLGPETQGVWGSEQMTNEIARAALRIAAQAGTRRDPYE